MQHLKAFYPELQEYIASMKPEMERIPESRKRTLEHMAVYIRERLETGDPVNLTFICTHNSRRSHMAQLWAATAAAYYGVDGVNTYSGGTEATAFNPRAVAALRRAGFHIEDPGGDNPRYQVTYAPDGPEMICFSKEYDHPHNPQKQFAAIMTCAEADENCPFIPGAGFRLSIPYDDPKEADGTPDEQVRYDERCRQIGREMFYALSRV
jgi:arsenate reductase